MGITAWDMVVSKYKKRQTTFEKFAQKFTVPSTNVVKVSKEKFQNVKEPVFSSSRGKRCAKCGCKKELEEFPTHSGSSDGRASYCRVCKNKLAADRRQKDPIARIKHYTVTRLSNEWAKEKLPKDLYTNLETYLGYQLWQLKAALAEDLKTREGISLQKSFELGYHLDHKVPHSSFNAGEIGDSEFQKCWAISNLWLIPAKMNLQKGAKLDYLDE